MILINVLDYQRGYFGNLSIALFRSVQKSSKPDPTV